MEFLHGLLYFTLVLSGFGIVMYKDLALQRGWRIGTNFLNDAHWIKIFGVMCSFGGIIEAFFEFRWWIVLLGAFIAWTLAGYLLLLLKVYSQLTVLFLSIISFIGIIIYQILVANSWI